MKSLASAAVLLLLAACSGGGSYGYDEGLPPAPLSGDLGQEGATVAGAAYAPPPSAYTPTPVAQVQPATDYAPPNPTGGPQGSSQPAPGEERYDAVGHAGAGGGNGVSAIVPALPSGSFAEVTALDTGRTIVVLVVQQGAIAPGQIAQLTPAAAQMLGVSGGYAPVRVRRVTPSPQDQGALRQGQPAADRMDAPQPLLAALRKRLPTTAAVAAPPPRAVAAPGTSYPRPGTQPARPAPATRGGWYVQVAALSNSSRAQALAQQLGGFVRPAGTVYRVQLGPFADAAAARAARDGAAGQGYADARVFSQN